MNDLSIVLGWPWENPIKKYFRACLHGGGGPQIGVVTCGGSPHLSCKRDQIKMRHYMDRRITPPKRVTSPTWGPPPQCKQALTRTIAMFTLRGWVGTLDKRIQQMDTAAKLPINRLRMISQDTVRGRLLISRVNAPMCLRHSGCNDNLETSFNLCAYALSVW